MNLNLELRTKMLNHSLIIEHRLSQILTRKSRSNPNLFSIYVRITIINGKRAEISLKRSVHQTQWDPSKSKGWG